MNTNPELGVLWHVSPWGLIEKDESSVPPSHHEPKVMLKNCVLFDGWETKAPSSNPIRPAVELICGARILFLLQGAFCLQALLLQPSLCPHSCWLRPPHSINMLIKPGVDGTPHPPHPPSKVKPPTRGENLGPAISGDS